MCCPVCLNCPKLWPHDEPAVEVGFMMNPHFSFFQILQRFSIVYTFSGFSVHAWIQWGTGGPDPPPPLKNDKSVGFLSNTGQDPLENNIATKSDSMMARL